MLDLLFLQSSLLPINVEIGLLGGLAVAVSGYLQASSKKDAKGNSEPFSIDKFTLTVLLGAVAGAGLSFLGELDGGLNTFLATAGVVAIVEALIKVVLRKK